MSKKSKCYPDLSQRPYTMTVERLIPLEAAILYQAWTSRFDTWFAEPGECFMKAEVDAPYFFYNRRDWGSHPHYGRYLALKENELIEMTWITGKGGTEGRETVLKIELLPQKEGTLTRLTHSGFENKAMRDGHEKNWPEGLAILEAAFKSSF